MTQLTLTRLGIATALLASSAIPALAQNAVTYERLVNPEPENWLTVYGNYQGWRYSELDEINRDNVAGLRLAFAVPLAMRAGLSGDNQTQPLVDDGFLYTVDMQNAVVKFDVGNGTYGTQLWRVETTPPESQGRIQAVALWGNNVYSVTRPGTVLAIDRDSGEVLWEENYVVPSELLDAAPIALEDRIIIGQAVGERGTRGYVIGVDPNDGTELWRTYMVPGPGEPGHETWPQDNDSWMTGGGGVWVAPTYDPETNSIFVGTGNPQPAWDAEFRAGDNLFTSSAVVLNGDTGEMVWYFQYAPNDAHEKDEISPHILFDAEIGGVTRQLVGHISRTGYYFTLDRNSGEFLSAAPQQSDITWTAGIDPKTGKPVEYDPNAELQRYLINPERGEETVDFCGGFALGGQHPPALDPERQLVFYTSPDSSCFTNIHVDFVDSRPAEERFGQQGYGGPLEGAHAGQRLSATDAVTGEIVAQTPLPTESRAGLLATAGDLVFFGDRAGTFMAYDADTLDLLWSISLGALIKAPPITYSVDGTQYIAIQTGGTPASSNDYRPVPSGANSSTLWVFSL